MKVVATGFDGNNAVKLYEQHKPDVIFTDIQMPKYDGFYAIENIKDGNPNAKIIVITGDLEASNSNLLNVLDVPVITKPFNMTSIKQAIADVFLCGTDLPSPFKIQYKFKDDFNLYSCIVTYEQYRNLKKLPIIQECEIMDNNPKQINVYQNEMEKALDSATKNDTRYIHKLSEVVD